MQNNKLRVKIKFQEIILIIYKEIVLTHIFNKLINYNNKYNVNK
jgi:hypothetical protein